MSQADELHSAIMRVIMEKMKNESHTYADVFGALETAKAFFQTEYAMKMALTWKEVLKEENVKS